jgi:hypothetical protein
MYVSVSGFYLGSLQVEREFVFYSSRSLCCFKKFIYTIKVITADCMFCALLHLKNFVSSFLLNRYVAPF